MSIVFLASAVISSVLCLFFFFESWKYYKLKIKAVCAAFFCGGGVHFLVAFFSILWIFDVVPHASREFSLLYTILILIQTFALFQVFYFFNPHKILLFLLAAYSAAVVFGFFVFKEFSFILIAPLLLILLLSLFFAFHSPLSRKSGIAGFGYAAVSIIAYVFFVLRNGDLLLFTAVSHFFLLLFLGVMFYELPHYPLPSRSQGSKHPAVGAFRNFIFTLVLTAFVFISTIGAHEFGHVLASNSIGCEARTIVFEKNQYPYSEVVCPASTQRVLVTFAGPILPLIIALGLYFVGGVFMREISFLIVGFNLLASAKDFTDVGMGETLILFNSLLGFCFLLVGVILLSRARVDTFSEQEESAIV